MTNHSAPSPQNNHEEMPALAWDPSGTYLEAASDPAVKQALREAEQEGAVPEPEQASLLRRSVATVHNLGKVMLNGDHGEMLTTAVRRVF
jgi:hypothetical protein